MQWVHDLHTNLPLIRVGIVGPEGHAKRLAEEFAQYAARHAVEHAPHALYAPPRRYQVHGRATLDCTGRCVPADWSRSNG